MNYRNLHLTDDQLIEHLYGIADEAIEPHLDSCAECQVRWAAIDQRRRVSSPQVAPASEEIFVNQRRAVLENATRTTPFRGAWLPASAAVLALAAIVLLRPAQPSRTAPPVSDPAPVLEAGWFDEAYASSVSEPRAAQPLRELFSSGEPNP